MPKATFSHRARTIHGPHVVWQQLQRAETWASIGPVDEVWSPVHDDNGALMRYEWSSRIGPTRHKDSATVVASDAGKLMRLDLDGARCRGR